MNKTVNINLANIFFHIDEEAYNKLRRYLESVKRSFDNTSGSDEILSDIEARIAELFHEKMENERQVVTVKEVDQVISIMGQPEDYEVDEDIFEDELKKRAPKAKAKKLYRDTDSKYLGGVCSGLSHYVGIDVIWVRIVFVLLLFGSGISLIAYILLWVLVPEAATTAQKLDMSGKTVNISNIEQKVKEGFETVSDHVKDGFDTVSEKVSNGNEHLKEKAGNLNKKVKSGSESFFEAIGNFILFVLKVFGKFIGILMVLIGATSLIGLLVGTFTVGIFDVVHIPGVDFYHIIDATNTPIWLISIAIFFALGIPFFFILYLGLKILITNLKSIGNIAKFSLLGLWFISIISLFVIGAKQASAHAYNVHSSNTEELYFNTSLDTILIKTKGHEFDTESTRINDMSIAYAAGGEKMLLSRDFRFDIRKSDDSIAHIQIRKEASGNSFNDARERSTEIDYNFNIVENTVVLNNFLTTGIKNKVRSQEVRATIYIPEGSVLQFDKSIMWRNIGITTRNDQGMSRWDMREQLWKMGEDGILICQDCPVEEEIEANEDDN